MDYQPLVPRSHPEDKALVQGEQVPAIGETRSTRSREFVQVFRDWYLGKGIFHSPEHGEKGLTMQISMRDFILFKEALDVDENEGFPKYSYNSSCSTLNIHRRTSPVHQIFVSTIMYGLHSATNGLPEDIESRVSAVANQLFYIFGVRFVLEVGLSETYDMLVKDAKMWLEGMRTVSVVMLLKMQEDPDYHFPTQGLSDEDFSRLESLRYQEIDGHGFTLESAYGPAVYKGLTWVGRISGFIEIWKCEPVSGLATRIGDRINLVDLNELQQVKFRLSEFLDVAHECDREISFRWGRYSNKLGSNIRELAANRYRRALMFREGRIRINRDYQPPSPTHSA
ncbi:hypothetical protein HOY80DRAFT_1060660 [Tuber brumale]|nr:hypothetical protein HOY80DRAFT_1060660 [Tuber brumale]